MSSSFHSQVFVDGPNIDMVLGKDILGHRPRPNERPRWDRVSAFARSELDCVKPTFVFNGNRFADGDSPICAFRRALRFMGYDVQCPRGSETDPVDEFILQGLRAIVEARQPCSVAVVSHDHGYAADLSAILMLGGTVWVIGFLEEMSPQLRQLEEQGANIIDIEHHLGAFNIRLPRPFLACCGMSVEHPPSGRTATLAGAA